MLISNINYPVKVTLTIQMRSGGTLALRGLLPEAHKDLIATFYQIVIRNPDERSPEQLSLVARRKPTNQVTSYQTQGGATVKTNDGIIWEKETTGETPTEPVAIEACKHGRMGYSACQLTEECLTGSCPAEQKSDRQEKEKKNSRYLACERYGIDCDSDERCRDRYECPRAELGAKAVAENDNARNRVVAEIKKKRGRPRKKPIDILHPRSSETWKPSFAPEHEGDDHVKNTCGERCLDAYVECYRCSDRGCTRQGKLLSDWTECGKKPDSKTCLSCTHDLCQFRLDNPDRVPFCQGDWCQQCNNNYCIKYVSSLSRLPDKPDNWYSFVENGILVEGVPQCVEYPKDDLSRQRCRETCLNTTCSFYKYHL